MQSYDTILVAIDNGYDSTKVYTNKECFSFKSKYEKADDDLNKNNTWSMFYNNENYLIGEGATIENHDDDKTNNELAKICTYAALSKLSNFIGVNFNLVLGYPLTSCSANKEDFINYIKSDSDIETIFNGEVKKFHINDCIVIPQGAGALYSRNPNEFKDKLIGILDIGGKTINGVIMDNLNPVRKSIFTEDLGIHILYNELCKEFALRGIKVNDYQIPYILKNNKYIDGADKVINDTFNKHVENIKDVMIKNKWNVDIMDIMVVGGGKLVLKNYLCKYIPHIVECEDAVFANVKGFYKVGEMYYGKENF